MIKSVMCTVFVGIALSLLLCDSASSAEYKGPNDVAVSIDGKTLFVAEKDAKSVAAVNLADNQVTKTYPMPGAANAVCVSPDGKKVYAACGIGEGCVAVIDLESSEVSKIPVGHTPSALCVSQDGSRMYVCNRFNNDVSVVDLKAGKEISRIAVLREPVGCAVTPDGKTVVVSNHLPIDASDSYDVACEVTCIDTTDESIQNVRLLNGATDLMGICVSPDGKYAFTISILARYQMPTTQLERGWMNTNALSIIDIENRKFFNTVLLDDIDLGAANPYDVAMSGDGNTLFVSHAGTHELSVIDAKTMLEKLESMPANREEAKATGTYDSSGSYSSSTAEDVPNDLAFLVGLRQRVKLLGNGARGVATSGNHAYVALYFTDTVASVQLDAVPRPKVTTIAVGPTPELDQQRLGEMYFHDAALCFQQWQSCASCHPDARVDALNWDLMNDGMGNPKNVKSMLLAHATPPAMISGVRADAETAVRAGIKHIQFAVRPEEDAVAIDEYLKNLEPVPSPYLVNGELSEAAKRGKELFSDPKVNCARCHPAPLYTDMQLHNLGTRGPYDRRDTFDTPTLVEVWRTYPYLHDGRHVTMHDLLTEGNHGGAGKLHEDQMQDLIEYVLSL